MEPIIISIAEQIIVVVVLSLLAGFAIGWLSVRAKYKAKYDYEATRDFFRRKPLYEWHTSIPCPGAFLICEVEKNRLIYGYAVSDGEGVAIMQLPDRVEMQRAHIARIEAGRYSVGLDTLTAIGQALGKRLAFV